MRDKYKVRIELDDTIAPRLTGGIGAYSNNTIKLKAREYDAKFMAEHGDKLREVRAKALKKYLRR